MAWIRLAPYVIAGFIVAALAGAALWYRGDAAKAETEAARLQSQNAGLLKIIEGQGAAIARLTTQRAIDERIAATLTSTLAAIQMDQAETSKAIADLKETDDDAREYLNRPIPDGVRRLLGNKPAPARP